MKTFMICILFFLIGVSVEKYFQVSVTELGLHTYFASKGLKTAKEIDRGTCVLFPHSCDASAKSPFVALTISVITFLLNECYE